MGRLSGREPKRLFYSIYHKEKICENLRNLWIRVLKIKHLRLCSKIYQMGSAVENHV
jgi:hypothetical protein